jgi:hypothetical protein
LLAVTGWAAASPVSDGSVVLRMCKGADRVKALSVMCHSYLNGHIDAAHHYGKGRAMFCLAGGDKERMPAALVAWIDAHPQSLKQPAGAVIGQALAEQFPCGRK